MKIHPTAIISSKADIHETAEIGPYTIIEDDVTIGEGTIIESGARIYKGTRIGKHNMIHHCATIGGLPQDLRFDKNSATFTIIGDNNIIREYVTIHRATKLNQATIVGNSTYLMENTHVGHDSIVGDNVIMVHCAGLAGHVHVENNAFISGSTGVHQFCKVGKYAMIGALSKIVKDAPPYSMVDGNPASVIGLNVVGLKRSGFSPDIRQKIKSTYKTIYHSKMNISQAIAKLKEENDPNLEVQQIIQFFESSDRGVIDHR